MGIHILHHPPTADLRALQCYFKPTKSLHSIASSAQQTRGTLCVTIRHTEGVLGNCYSAKCDQIMLK